MINKCKLLTEISQCNRWQLTFRIEKVNATSQFDALRIKVIDAKTSFGSQLLQKKMHSISCVKWCCFIAVSCRTCNTIRIISRRFGIESAETWNKCGAWFLMRRHFGCSKKICNSTKKKREEFKWQIVLCTYLPFTSRPSTPFVDQCTVRTRSAHINRETIVRLRRRQRHHPKSHRTHTKNVWCCWYLHTSVVHSTFHIWILLFCFFSFGFLSFFKICFSWQWKREAAQTISLMRYLQMLWRVETMLEICLEFVPLYRFLNLHKQRFSCKYFCRRFERGHQRCTHQTTHLQIVDSIFYLLICVCFWNSIGSDRWLSSSREHVTYIMGISGH